MCTSGLFSVALLWIVHYLLTFPLSVLQRTAQLSAHCCEQRYHCRGWVGLNEQQQPYPFKLCHHLWAETEVKALLVGPFRVADVKALVVYSVPASASLTAPVWTWPLLTSRHAALLPTPAVRFWPDWLHSVHFKAAAAGKPLICSQTDDQPNPHRHIQMVSCSRGKVITDSDWLKPGLMWECDSLRPELCPSACIHKQLHNSLSSSLTLFMAHLQHLDLASHIHCFKHTLYLYHALRPHSTKQSCYLWLRLSVFFEQPSSF